MASGESYTPDADLSYEVPIVLSEADESWVGERRHRPRKRKAKGRRTRGRERASIDAGHTEQREGGERPGGGDGPGGSVQRVGRQSAGPVSGGRGQRGARGGNNAGPSTGGGGRRRRRRGGRDAVEEDRIQVLQNERTIQTEALIQQMSEVGAMTINNPALRLGTWISFRCPNFTPRHTHSPTCCCSSMVHLWKLQGNGYRH
ncbi:twist-related protein 1-like [Sphaeramia orbicularis]|uniref:twist-related protein 1-like n=1 Tax=Sphaeramia orbicularis TaxID=375764 RepID=UPI00117FDEC8|nr:twist-related protein 1-like [Sphaeramia orbicularis]